MTIAESNLQAFNESIRSSVPDVVKELRGILGAKLVAYIAQVSETRAVREWADGDRDPAPNAEQRLRAAHQALRLITASEGEAIVPTWFQGMNPQLDDRSPARVLHDEDDAESAGRQVLAAARVFVSA